MLKNKLLLLGIFIFGIFASRDLFSFGYFPMHDDLQMMRQLELEKCFLDGQIPCRWVPDMGYGFGYPLFNFYPPLPYFVGSIFRLLGFAFTDTAKYTFALSIVVSGFGMYFFSKELFGRLGGFLSAIFYIWAPYHALDIYVRGAMNEAWAMTIFPFIFYSGYKLLTDTERRIKKWTILFTLSYTGLFLSHNLMLMIFTPFFGLWALIVLWQKRMFKRILPLALGGVWALGLSSFFTLPALFENKFTWIRSQIGGYYDFTAHFASVGQLLFSRFWGFGGSIFGPEDGMAFPVGHLHWILSIFAGIVAIYFAAKRKVGFLNFLKKDVVGVSVFYFLLFGWLAAFMTHSKSIFIWLSVPQLAYLQFPWRLLTLTTFAFSLIVGVLPALLIMVKKGKGSLLKMVLSISQIFLVVFLSIFVVLWNLPFFKVERIGPVTDSEKFSGEAWRIQQTAGIYDYLPLTSEMAPQSMRGEEVELMRGKSQISGYHQGTYWAKFNVEVLEESTFRLNLLHFPGWRLFANASEIDIFIPGEEKWGRMWFSLPAGKYTLYAQFFNTPIRTISNLISLVSWGVLSFYIFSKKTVNSDSLPRAPR